MFTEAGQVITSHCDAKRSISMKFAQRLVLTLIVVIVIHGSSSRLLHGFAINVSGIDHCAREPDRGGVCGHEPSLDRTFNGKNKLLRVTVNAANCGGNQA